MSRLPVVQAERYFGSDSQCWLEILVLFRMLRTQVSKVIYLNDDRLYVNICGYCYIRSLIDGSLTFFLTHEFSNNSL